MLENQNVLLQLKNAIENALPFKADTLNKGIFEVYEESIGTHTLSVGISYETFPENSNAPVYIFNLFADEEYVNIAGEYTLEEIAEVYQPIVESWLEYEDYFTKKEKGGYQ